MTEVKTLWWVLGINAVFFVLEVLTGCLFSSFGVTADGFDMACDAVIYGLSVLALTKCNCFKKYIVNISGGALIISALVGFGLIVQRFFNPDIIPNYLGMAVISMLAFTGNYISLYLLQKLESDKSNIKAVVICSSKDCLVNLGVILSAFCVYLFNSRIPDMIIGSIVFVLVVYGAKEILELKSEKCEIHTK